MTFSSVSASDCGVEEVAAMAAGMTGLRSAAGGSAACWRGAGARTGLIGIGAPSDAGVLTVFFAEAGPADFSVCSALASSLVSVLPASVLPALAFSASIFALISASVFFQSVAPAFASACLETAWRAIGRGLGSETFALAEISAKAADPTDNTKLAATRYDHAVDRAVDRKAAPRINWVTAFLCARIIIRCGLDLFD